MILKFDNPQYYYDLFYQLSSLIVILIYLFEGHRRKIPWVTMLLVVVTTRFFLITGSKLGGINADDLNYFFQHLSFPVKHTRNMAGALLLALAGLGVAKLLLRIKYPILDAFAIATPFGMAIQRIGCLLTGCCFGTETHLPIGIQYGMNTPAFFHQFYAGHLGAGDELSLHIHPVPLYFILHSIIVGILLIRYRNYWKRPGNLALSALILILAGWFCIEFFRDPISNGTFLGSAMLGLKKIQVIYLVFISLLVATIYYREKNFVQKKYQIQENHPIHNSLYLALLVALLIATRNWFNIVEFNILLFVLFPVSIGIVIEIIRHLYSIQVKLSVAFLILLSFLLMGQTIPDDEKTIYYSIKTGFSGGSFNTTHNIGTGEGCDRMSQSQDFNQKYRMAGAGFSITEERNKQITEYGINGFAGSHKELGKSSLNETHDFIIGINPYIKFDTKWLGLGGGLHLGSLRYSPQYWEEEESAKLPETGTRKSPVFPQIYARVGPKHIAFISYKFADQFPSPFPGWYQNLEVGSGFGLKNGFNIRYGTDIGEKVYLTGYIPLDENFVIEPFYGWMNSYDIEPTHHKLFSLGLHYRFGHKTKMVTQRPPIDGNQ